MGDFERLLKRGLTNVYSEDIGGLMTERPERETRYYCTSLKCCKYIIKGNRRKTETKYRVRQEKTPKDRKFMCPDCGDQLVRNTQVVST